MEGVPLLPQFHSCVLCNLRVSGEGGEGGSLQCPTKSIDATPPGKLEYLNCTSILELKNQCSLRAEV